MPAITRAPEIWNVDGVRMRVWGEPTRGRSTIINNAYPNVYFTDALEPRDRMRVDTSRGPVELVGVGVRPTLPPPPPAPPPSPSPVPAPAPPPRPRQATEPAPKAQRVNQSGARIVALLYQEIAAAQAQVDGLHATLQKMAFPTARRAFDTVPADRSLGFLEAGLGTDGERQRHVPRFLHLPTAEASLAPATFIQELADRRDNLLGWVSELTAAIEQHQMPPRFLGNAPRDFETNVQT